MNIFFLSLIQSHCAKYHVDKHVVKMILETCQLLCCAHHLHPNSVYTPPYRLTHKNHPCAIWTRTSLDNYKWLVVLGLELCKEYTYRYGKVHKCQSLLHDLNENHPSIPSIGFTTPAKAMPDDYKINTNNITDCITSYRNYYYFAKTDLHSWKKRKVPYWILEYQKEYFEVI